MKFASYTKNRIPHKTLGGKSSLEILHPVTDIIAERSNLRKFGEEAIVHNYGVTDKMAHISTTKDILLGIQIYTVCTGLLTRTKNER
jgi:hypothetical protein